MMLKRVYPITLTFAALFLQGSLLGQTGSIHGRVQDPTGAAVPGASLQLYRRDGGSRLRTASSESGAYIFDSLPAAEYMLEASTRDLNSGSGKVLRVAPGQNLTVDLKLELPRVSSRVVITATATAESTDQTSKAFDVIDTGEMDRREEYSAVEAMRLTPGLRVMQLGGPGSLTRVHTRGLRAFDSSLLIDGFRFRDTAAPQADATGFLGDFLLIDSERIEVLRGSGSSLYGTHAIGGVINLVTDQGGGPLHGDFTMEGGGLGLLRTGAKLAGAAWKERLLYSAGLMHLNVSKGVDGDDAHRNTSGQGFAQFRLDGKTLLSGRVFANGSFTQLNIIPSAMPLSRLPAVLPVPAIEASLDPARATFTRALNDPDSSRSSDFLSGLFNFTRQFTPGVSFRANYQAVSSSRRNRDGPGGPGFQPRFNNENLFEGRIDTVQMRTDAALGRRHLISAGYEYEREAYDNRSRDENPASPLQSGTKVHQGSHALFAQEQFSLGARLRISLSGRMQNFDLSKPEFSGGAPQYGKAVVPTPPNAYTGDAAVSYFLTGSGTKLRAHAGNAYRAPALYERYGTGFFGGSFSPYGDPRLAPERSIAVDGGFDQYFANSRVKVSGTYFYTRLQQVIAFDFSGAILPGTDPYNRFGGYRNTHGGLARGMEWSIEAHPTRTTRFNSSYTYTNADERTSSLVGGSVSSIRVSNHMFTTTATQRITKNLDVTIDLFAASDYIYPLFAGGSRPFQWKAPLKADLVASYRHPLRERRSVEFYTRIENLFNRSYFEDGFAGPKAWAVGGIKLRF